MLVKNVYGCLFKAKQGNRLEMRETWVCSTQFPWVLGFGDGATYC